MGVVGFENRSGDARVVGWTGARAGERGRRTHPLATGRTSHIPRHSANLPKGVFEG